MSFEAINTKVLICFWCCQAINKVAKTI